jgi:hypothetical protein
MINIKLLVLTETGNTPDHLVDYSTSVSIGILEAHLLSEEILSLQVLRSSSLDHKWEMSALTRILGIIAVPSARHLSALS